MLKFSVEYKVYAMGSIYRGKEVIEATSSDDAKKKILASNKNILSCVSVEEVK